MALPRCVVITGAAGNLGRKLRGHLEGRCALRLLDREPRGDAAIQSADLAVWDPSWTRQFQGADAVCHLAGDAEAYHDWPELTGPNLDAMIHVYAAAAAAGVRRFVFASSNHVMGGYQDQPEVRLTPELAPRPGLRYVVAGQQRNSAAYAAAKLFGERVGRCYADMHGLEVIAVRLGWVLRGGPNDPARLPVERGPWFRLMWLSDRDYLQLMQRCLEAELPMKFLVVNGMSANTGMQWDLESTGRILGYQPQDDVTRG